MKDLIFVFKFEKKLMFVRAIAHSWSYSNNIRIEYKNN